MAAQSQLVLSNESIHEANPNHYVVHCGLRYVIPYVFQYRMHSKRRWLNRLILDVFLSEFSHHGPLYWEKEIASGRILADGKPATLSTRWTDGRTLLHTVHRHESPAIDSPIDIIYEDASIVVVNKPSSAPVHPCGTYLRNSLTNLMAAFHGIKPLFTVHRLDKQTSGVVMLAKTREKADELTAAMKRGQVLKIYIARVKGNFSDQVKECDAPLLWNKQRFRASVSDEGKPARTKFRKLCYLSKTNESIVEARPVTGRSHQIRAHLMHLGFPISNDWMYLDREETHLPQVVPGDLGAMREEEENCGVGWENEIDLLSLGLKQEMDSGQSMGCTNCPRIANTKRVRSAEMTIYLHAQEYRALSLEFKTELPKWAESATERQNSKQDRDGNPCQKYLYAVS